MGDLEEEREVTVGIRSSHEQRVKTLKGTGQRVEDEDHRSWAGIGEGQNMVVHDGICAAFGSALEARVEMCRMESLCVHLHNKKSRQFWLDSSGQR